MKRETTYTQKSTVSGSAIHPSQLGWTTKKAVVAGGWKKEKKGYALVGESGKNIMQKKTF